MNLKVKLILIQIARGLTHTIHLFPIEKKKIVLSSFGGKPMCCNPYYIYKSLNHIYPKKFKYLWVTQDIPPKNSYGNQIIKLGSLNYLWHMLTAGCVITNDTLPTFLKFSKKQLVINTWHGGGLFKCTFGKPTKAVKEYTTKVNALHNSDINLYVSSSESWSDKVVKRRFGYTGELLNCGMPRNDIFFRDNTLIIAKVKKHFNIPNKYGIVLYAPTFRGSPNGARNGILETHPIDVSMVLQSLKDKYGKDYCFIFRGHHLLSKSMDNCLNASDYPDMQELLAASDVLITDYSSSLWDFSLAKKPSFIYAPDFEEYSKMPGFESDYREWPFPIAQSNMELASLIRNFDTIRYAEKCKEYHQKYGSFESGKASETVANYIVSHLLKNKRNGSSTN